MISKVQGLYAITIDGSDSIVSDTEQALLGGVKIVQYRDKSHNIQKRLQQGGALKNLCDRFSACFIVNDDLSLALELDACGLHIGQDDGDVQAIKASLGNKILGVSCYNSLDKALVAQDAGADYVAFGRFFPSTTKPDAIQANIDLISRAKSTLEVPVVAIGGITTKNASLLIDAGVDAIAVIDGLFRQADIKATAGKFKDLFRETLI